MSNAGRIALIDYGAGNLTSVRKALTALGATFFVPSTPEQFAGAVEANVVEPLRAAMISDRSRKAQETAATRVDFYTLVRGEG